MSASVVKELYNSSNGDCWNLCRNSAGKLVVSHKPNPTSGGRASEVDVEVFLSRGGNGPEHQALMEALANLDNRARINDTLSVQAADKLSRALGEAVARCWSS